MDDEACYYPVQRPAAHEGVGRALRSAYYKSADDILPPEMIDLLRHLNQMHF